MVQVAPTCCKRQKAREKRYCSAAYPSCQEEAEAEEGQSLARRVWKATLEAEMGPDRWSFCCWESRRGISPAEAEVAASLPDSATRHHFPLVLDFVSRRPEAEVVPCVLVSERGWHSGAEGETRSHYCCYGCCYFQTEVEVEVEEQLCLVEEEELPKAPERQLRCCGCCGNLWEVEGELWKSFNVILILFVFFR